MRRVKKMNDIEFIKSRKFARSYREATGVNYHAPREKFNGIKNTIAIIIVFFFTLLLGDMAFNLLDPCFNNNMGIICAK